MIRNRLYYALKPYVPAAVRLAVRRWFALRKRSRVSSEWPVKPGSEKAPPGWSGWPGGKKFALVLTHDVEGQRGLDQCRDVLALESRLGFRSSFNFIPQGEYRVPAELIDELQKSGFEVGVHDLHHDGNLYMNRRRFAEKAILINRYLKEWGAVGFRSGFMLRELDWLHEIDIQYDASTFDTDPFEPQPDGVDTIFPFWVPSPALEHHRDGQGSNAKPTIRTERHSNGYVELPYTLCQDSTLFNVFQERTIDLWRVKLDWVAAHGGMALLNVHPDYLSFGRNGESSAFQYPSGLYQQLLEHVKNTYGGDCWQPLPRDVAALVRNTAMGAFPAEALRASAGY